MNAPKFAEGGNNTVGNYNFYVGYNIYVGGNVLYMYFVKDRVDTLSIFILKK